MRISIVTPSYNQGGFIEEALLSVRNQKYPALEHIVVDGASNDNTVPILKACASKAGWEHLRWVSEKDRGQTDAINKGLRQATGDILAYLCSDDLYVDGTFAHVADFFSRNDNVDMVYGGCRFIDSAGTPLRVKPAVPFDMRRLLQHNFIWQPAVFFRRSLWQRVGEFNPDLRYAMDYEYWLRAARVCRIAPLDHVLACYRWQSDSKTIANEPAQLKEAYEVACRFGGGGARSWYLHRWYWPKTSRAKRWVFSRFSGTRIFR